MRHSALHRKSSTLSQASSTQPSAGTAKAALDAEVARHKLRSRGGVNGLVVSLNEALLPAFSGAHDAEARIARRERERDERRLMREYADELHQHSVTHDHADVTTASRGDNNPFGGHPSSNAANAQGKKHHQPRRKSLVERVTTPAALGLSRQAGRETLCFSPAAPHHSGANGIPSHHHPSGDRPKSPSEVVTVVLSPEERQTALAAFQDHFAGVLRPVSVTSQRRSATPMSYTRSSPRGATNSNAGGGSSPRALTPAVLEQRRRKAADEEKYRITVEASVVRRETRRYISDVTRCLRNDPELFEAYSEHIEHEERRRRHDAREAARRDGDDRGGSLQARLAKPFMKISSMYGDDSGDESGDNKCLTRVRSPSPVAEEQQRLKQQQEHRRQQHSERCEHVYEAKQRLVLEDFLRLEQEQERVRGEQFSRDRWFSAAIIATRALMNLSQAVLRARQERVDGYVDQICEQRSAAFLRNDDESEEAQLAAKQAAELAALRAAAEKVRNTNVGDVVNGVHRTKVAVVETRRLATKQFRPSPELAALIAELRPLFPYWLMRFNLRRKRRAAARIKNALMRAKDLDNTRQHIRAFLRHTQLIVRAWKVAFVRERHRVAALCRQFEYYAAERYQYNAATCTAAERDLRKREKTVAKNIQTVRALEAHALTITTPLDLRRRAENLRRLIAPELFEKSGLKKHLVVSAHVSGLTEGEVARVVAAPWNQPSTYGQLGRDPLAARTAAQVTLAAFGPKAERMPWKLPPRTRDFVVAFANTRERMFFAAEISQYLKDLVEARVKLRRLLFAAQYAPREDVVQLMREVDAWQEPPKPRRPLLFRPNEMRLLVHLGVLLHQHERKLHAERSLNVDRFVEPDIVATVYTVKNATVFLNKAASTLGRKLTNIRPSLVDEPPFPISVPPPSIPAAMLRPSTTAAS
jgi:hypothetical protein